eukprot:403333038
MRNQDQLLVHQTSMLPAFQQTQNQIPNLTRKRVSLCLSALFDLSLFIGLLTFLTLYYYDDPKARILWKVGLTCNSIALLFEFRMRVLRCFGYPLKDMRAIGSCIEFTRIRMKLADYFCFFYIFFSEMINASVLVMKQYRSEHERNMFIAIVSLNAVYIVTWIIFTRSKSFQRFPKEKHRNSNYDLLNTPGQNTEPRAQLERQDNSLISSNEISLNQPISGGINQDIIQEFRTPSQTQERRKLNKKQAKNLVNTMPVIKIQQQDPKNSKKQSLLSQSVRFCSEEELIKQSCAICLEFLVMLRHQDNSNTSKSNEDSQYQDQDMNQVQTLQAKISPSKPKQLFRSFIQKIQALNPAACPNKTQQFTIREFPECQHLYHEICLQNWIQENDSCPMCRRRSNSTCLDDSSRDNVSDDEFDDDIENLLFNSEKTQQTSRRYRSNISITPEPQTQQERIYSTNPSLNS